MYLGWRSQERLDIGPAYLTSPAQRLAFSAASCSVKPVAHTVKKDLKQVTEAILDFCNGPIRDKPLQVKEAWPQMEEYSDENIDNDSGIDRSDDFTQEIINEA